MVDFAVVATLVISTVDLFINAVILPFSTGTLDLQICGRCFQVHHESLRDVERATHCEERDAREGSDEEEE